MVLVCSESGEIISVHGEFLRVHDVQLGRKMRETEVSLEADVRFALRSCSRLSRDNDDTVRSSGTINCCR